MYPLQRYFGYAYAYDAAALAMNAIIDCEPIFFDYAGKTWMIELWKGQYGLETGCEIGVYNRDHRLLIIRVLDPGCDGREATERPEPVAQSLLRLRKRQRAAVDGFDAVSQRAKRSSAEDPKDTGG